MRGCLASLITEAFRGHLWPSPLPQSSVSIVTSGPRDVVSQLSLHTLEEPSLGVLNTTSLHSATYELPDRDNQNVYQWKDMILLFFYADSVVVCSWTDKETEKKKRITSG